jgi:DNA primase
VSIFEVLRDRVGLDLIVSANDSGKVHCVSPGHQDENPSMHLYDDRAHCFACGFHGDVTDVWAAMRGFVRPLEAALDLAGEFGIELPEVSPEARQKARERRDKEDFYLQQAKACHGALARHPRVTEWWEARGFGQELRQRFLLGTNKDGTVAVIPFWHQGRVQGLIRRKLEGKPKYLYPKAEEFPGGYRPLFIPASVRSGAFLTEGIVDALALAAIGEGAIAVGGTGLSRKQLRELDAVPLYILPDADEEGEQAAREWVRKLYPKALVCPAESTRGRPPVRKDFADVFADQGEAAREVLGHLRERAVDALHLELSEAPKGSNSLGAYRVAKERVLPLLLKLEDEGERDAALHDVAAKLKLSIKSLRKALAAMLEEQRGSREEQAEAAGDGAPGARQRSARAGHESARGSQAPLSGPGGHEEARARRGVRGQEARLHLRGLGSLRQADPTLDPRSKRRGQELPLGHHALAVAPGDGCEA